MLRFLVPSYKIKHYSRRLRKSHVSKDNTQLCFKTPQIKFLISEGLRQ